MATLIVSNWKMNPQTLKEAQRIVQATKQAVEKKRGVRSVIAPPAIFLRDLAKRSRSKKVLFASQHIHWEADGSHTGEHSVGQVKEAGAKYAIIGHAERRALGESNEDTQKKVLAAVEGGLIPILCIGEEDRDVDGVYLSVLAKQILIGLRLVPKSKLKNVIIAYEPVWAIGKDEAMGSHEVHETSLYIRKVLTNEFDKDAAKIPVLYGGSVDETNARELLEHGEVNGFLVGRASANPERIGNLIESLA